MKTTALTNRERDVLINAYVLLDNEEIAQVLRISPAMVLEAKEQALEKLGKALAVEVAA